LPQILHTTLPKSVGQEGAYWQSVWIKLCCIFFYLAKDLVKLLKNLCLFDIYFWFGVDLKFEPPKHKT
jgi:hypothetical protein